jgi:hypothetical protein
LHTNVIYFCFYPSLFSLFFLHQFYFVFIHLQTLELYIHFHILFIFDLKVWLYFGLSLFFLSVLRFYFSSIFCKGKMVLLHAMDGAWEERRYSSYTFLTSALEGGEWSASRPGRALPPGREPPVPIVQEAGWAPEQVWAQRLAEIEPDCPVRSQALLTELPRLISISFAFYYLQLLFFSRSYIIKMNATMKCEYTEVLFFIRGSASQQLKRNFTYLWKMPSQNLIQGFHYSSFFRILSSSICTTIFSFHSILHKYYS